MSDRCDVVGLGETAVRQRSRRGAGWTALAAVGSAAVWLGCLASGSQRIDEIRQALVGVPARNLPGCLGVPFDTSVDGDTEYLTYRWLEEDDGIDPFDRTEDLGRTPTTRRPRDLSRERLENREDLLRNRVGYCELILEVRGGRVRNVEVEGRRSSGLNDDFRCVSNAQGCVKSKK